MNEMIKMLRQYDELIRMEKEIKQEIETIKKAIQAQMAVGQTLEVGDYKVSWTVSTRKDLDREAIKAQFPEALNCIKETEVTRFSIK